MSLSAPIKEARHLRRISCEGFARIDGLLDIEGELIDTNV